jgi:hypothetical protein
MTYFDQDGRPMAVDTTLPVDILEPEDCEAPERVLSAAQFRWLVIRIARTFFTGEPKITVVAWRIIAGDTWDSIRACARRAGCTAQAVSRRLGIIREDFGLRPTAGHQRSFDRWMDGERFKTIRRGDRNPPAADEDQLKTNTHATRKGGRP